MKGAFAPLQDPASLPRRALVFAAHAGDEVVAIGGLLALHAARGDQVLVVCLQGAAEELRARARRAARALGCGEPRFAGLGALDREEGLTERLEREIRDFAPEACYLPSPIEAHPDHRAASTSALRAIAAAESGAPIAALGYGLSPTALPGDRLFDVTAVWDRKRQALAAFEGESGVDSASGKGLVAKSAAAARARTLAVEDAEVEFAESVWDLRDPRVAALGARLVELGLQAEGGARRSPRGEPDGDDPQRRAATAVISTWNKKDDLRENLASIAAQQEPFADVVVVDNASSDGTAAMVAAEFPAVRLIRMPHSAYGACETFNIGFASATTPLVAILDDDIVLPPEWLARTRQRLLSEPSSTAIVSTKIVEPEMPKSYRESPAVNAERYMSTFRGCGSLARTEALAAAGFYDERLFIYGNERDLTCRLLNLGYRVLQYPGVETHHKTPFGMKMGKRSLYFHARNAWLTMLKYAPAADLARLPWLVLKQVVMRGSAREAQGGVTDATGTIGLGRALRETPGAWWILARAAGSVLMNVPYCLARRAPVRHPDFDLPLR